MHQIWGMGIPFLRLPLEAIVSIWDGSFPDRITFLLFYFISGYLLFTMPLLDGSNNRPPLVKYLARMSTLLLLLFNSAILNLAGNYFRVYEEAIVYSYTFQLVSFALLVRLSANPTAITYNMLAVVSGYLFVIRPTGLIYGTVGMAIAFFLSRGLPKRVHYGGVFAWLFTISVGLFSNWIRFDNLFEFGYHMHINAAPMAAFASRLPVPGQLAPWWPLSKELFGRLFFPGEYQSWLSGVFVFSEVDFPIFNITVLILWIAALLLPLFFCVLKNKFRWELVLPAAWGAPCAIVLFCFYVRFGAFVSRYYVDLAAAIFVPISALAELTILGLSEWLPIGWARAGQLLIVASALAWGLSQFPGHLQPPVNQEWVKGQMHAQLSQMYVKTPKIPDDYNCPDPNIKRDIPYNAVGWRGDGDGDCSVSEATVLFFNNPVCIEYKIKPAMPLLEPSKLFEVARVFVGRSEWQPVTTKVDGQTATKVYCAKEGEDFSGLQLAFISWIEPMQMGHGRGNLKLLSARLVTRP